MEKYFKVWDGRKYPIRVVPLDEKFGFGSHIKVASRDLWFSLEYDRYEGNEEAVRIDDSIFCYIDAELIDNDASDEEIKEYVIKHIL